MSSLYVCVCVLSGLSSDVWAQDDGCLTGLTVGRVFSVRALLSSRQHGDLSHLSSSGQCQKEMTSVALLVSSSTAIYAHHKHCVGCSKIICLEFGILEAASFENANLIILCIFTFVVAYVPVLITTSYRGSMQPVTVVVGSTMNAPRCPRIIVAASVLTMYFMTFFVMSIRDEADVIRSTLHELLQKQEVPCHDLLILWLMNSHCAEYCSWKCFSGVWKSCRDVFDWFAPAAKEQKPEDVFQSQGLPISPGATGPRGLSWRGPFWNIKCSAGGGSPRLWDAWMSDKDNNDKPKRPCHKPTFTCSSLCRDEFRKKLIWLLR